MAFRKRKMKRAAICLAFLFSATVLLGQEGSALLFTLEGFVTEADSKKPLEGATVKLVGSDNTSFEVKTDAKGYYRFEAHGQVRYVNAKTAYVVSASGLDIKTLDFSDGVLGNPKGKITTVDIKESTCFRQDFILQKRKPSYYPLVVFKKNSTAFLNSSVLNNIQLISKWYDGNVVLEITGRAGAAEKNPHSLALERALVIKKQFVKIGNSPEKYELKGEVVSDSLLINSDYYKECKEWVTLEEFRTSALFRVVRVEFPVDPAKITPEIKVTSGDGEGK